MSAKIQEGEISPKVYIFAGAGALAGGILGAATLGFPPVIAAVAVFGIAGGVFGSFF